MNTELCGAINAQTEMIAAVAINKNAAAARAMATRLRRLADAIEQECLSLRWMSINANDELIRIDSYDFARIFAGEDVATTRKGIDSYVEATGVTASGMAFRASIHSPLPKANETTTAKLKIAAPAF